MVNIYNVTIMRSNAKNLTNLDYLHIANFSLALQLKGFKRLLQNIRMHIFLSLEISYAFGHIL